MDNNDDSTKVAAAQWQTQHFPAVSMPRTARLCDNRLTTGRGEAMQAVCVVSYHVTGVAGEDRWLEATAIQGGDWQSLARIPFGGVAGTAAAAVRQLTLQLEMEGWVLVKNDGLYPEFTKATMAVR